MARFKIGDIIKFKSANHLLILDIASEVSEFDRYIYLALENGHISKGLTWWVDKNSEWIS